MPLCALIFDVDGTLADTERQGHRLAFNAAFREHGLDWHWDAALYGVLLSVTGGMERLLHYARRYRPGVAARQDFAEFARRLHDSKTRHYQGLLTTGAIRLRPGVASLITEARDARLRLAIATTSKPENVRTLLRVNLAADAERWFEVIAAGDIVPAKKPAPDIYLYVLRSLGLAAAECLAIEDSAVGLAACRGAGIPAIVTSNDYTRRDDFSGALAVLPDLAGTGLAQLRQWHRDGARDDDEGRGGHVG